MACPVFPLPNWNPSWDLHSCGIPATNPPAGLLLYGIYFPREFPWDLTTSSRIPWESATCIRTHASKVRVTYVSNVHYFVDPPKAVPQIPRSPMNAHEFSRVTSSHELVSSWRCCFSEFARRTSYSLALQGCLRDAGNVIVTWNPGGVARRKARHR